MSENWHRYKFFIDREMPWKRCKHQELTEQISDGYKIVICSKCGKELEKILLDKTDDGRGRL